MSQNVYILSDSKLTADKVSEDIFVNRKFISETLTADILIAMANDCRVEYFYIIKADFELKFLDFDFSFKPDAWDKHYMHIWNNEIIIRLLNKKEVLKDPHRYTDEAYLSGSAEIKNIDKKIYNFTEFDIVFISYGEISADANYENLRCRFPRVKRIDNVSGILRAHQAAARIAETRMFYVVDADADILKTFNFDYDPMQCNVNSVYVWHSHNPINNLEYGFGAIKMFPKQLLLDYSGSPVDFTTTVASSLTVIPEVSNVTRFNTDPFSTWRSAFRECTKLSSKVIHNQVNSDTDERLDTWCNVANGEFGEYAVSGAIAGRAFGEENIDQPEMLVLINDFDWLKQKFLAVGP